jgi:hypothetical protein
MDQEIQSEEDQEIPEDQDVVYNIHTLTLSTSTTHIHDPP